jgi:hypothetical protein
MADSGAPPMTIRAAVRDLADRTPLQVESLSIQLAPFAIDLAVDGLAAYLSAVGIAHDG